MRSTSQQMIWNLYAAIYRATPVLLLLWWCAYSVPIFESEDIGGELEAAASATQSGSLYNQALIVAFFAIGAVHLPAGMRALRNKYCVRLAAILFLYISWCLTTVYWSDDPLLSLKRLAAFTLLLVGCFGIGAGYYGWRDHGILHLSRHVVVVATVSTLALLVSSLLRGDLLDFTAADWSLKASVRVSFFGYCAGFGVLASLLTFRNRPVPRALFPVLYLSVLLFILKGRTMLVCTVAAACLMTALTTRERWLRTALVCAALGTTLFVLDLGTGGRMVRASAMVVEDSNLLDYATLGAGSENILELSGRGPLWDALATYLERRPFLGHGFGAFWTGSRIDQIYVLVGWGAVNAHNGFYDELLATGLIGTAMMVAFWLSGIRTTLSQAALFENPAMTYLVCSWIYLLLLFNFMDSALHQFFFHPPAVIALMGLSALMSGPAALDTLFAAGKQAHVVQTR